MKYLKIFSILLFSLFFYSKITAQNNAVSPNSRYFATISSESKIKDTIRIEKRDRIKEKLINSYLTEIDIFQLRSLNWIRRISIKSRKKLKITDMGFNYSGKTFYIKTKKQINVWNVKSGNLIFNAEGDCKYAFSNFSDFFIIYRNQELLAYDNQSGNMIKEYNFPKSYNAEKIDISSDDKYIVVNNGQGMFYFYKVGKARTKKRIKGSIYRFVKKENSIVVLRKKEDKFYCYLYSLPKFKRINYFKGYSKNEDLSDDGKFLSAFLKRNTLNNKFQKYDLLNIYDTETGFKWASIVSTDTLKTQLKNLSWLEHELISFDQEHSSTLYSISSNRMVIDLDYVFEFENNNLSINRQMQNIQVSKNKRYVALQDYKGTQPILYLKASAILGSKAFCPNVEFVSFTPNSKYILVKRMQGGYGMIKCADIEAIRENLSEVKVYKFSDFLNEPVPESEIAEDGEEPEDYKYKRIEDFKHISSVPDSLLINLYLKTIEVTDSHTGLQVHLLDKNGTYYYGASEYKWKHIWKNLLLQDQHGKIKEVKDFEVVEYSANDNLPTALAIVMDHSGSMGEKRAQMLQKGAKLLIKQKEDYDAITIIKYDHDIGVEVPLSKTQKRLKKDLKINGLGKYGGATSLLDAIDRAVNILKHAEGYKRKAVVILTDGNENSSIIPKGQMLKSASSNNVSIFTIGFGDFVSQEYLKALSFYTQGSYYQIYKTSDFDWIFKDVYKKMRNYYSIRFNTDSVGVYTALLEIELDDKRGDKLATTFDNTPFDFDLLDENDFDYEFKPPLQEVQINEVVMKDLVNYRDSIITVENNITKEKQEAEIKQRQEEFSKINLPNIQFVYSEVEIVKTSEKGIEQVVSFMKKYPSAKLKISGHTDNVGDAQDNLQLSLARAKAVKKLIVRKGINSKRIKAIGMGDKKPIDTNETEEGRKLNRRVEFEIEL